MYASHVHRLRKLLLAALSTEGKAFRCDALPEIYGSATNFDQHTHDFSVQGTNFLLQS
jgi:hypothetical protein